MRTTEEDVDAFVELLSERLIRELRKRDCSIVALAHDCGLSDRGLGKIIYKDVGDGLRLSTVFKICRGLGISPSSLIAEMEKQYPGRMK